jgi:tripartite-type tricarboxylate transporter receptor subunit TctC
MITQNRFAIFLRCFVPVMAAVMVIMAAGQAKAAWPNQPITIIVPFPAGGPSDLLGRLLGVELSNRLGTSVIVENRVGAAGNIGITAGARAEPNGYTLLAATGVILINPHVAKVAYDPIKDFETIAYLGASPGAIVANPKSGISSAADLIAKAKANPGKITIATVGVGSLSHLASELLQLRTGIKLLHVPFPGAAPALQAALAGTTDIASVPIANLVSHIQSGSLKGLLQTGAEKWRDLPNVPTMAEAGIANAVVETEQMLLAPAGTPAPIIERLAKETREILLQPDIKEKMAKAGFAVRFEGPEQLRARMIRDAPVWKDLVERIGLKR